MVLNWRNIYLAAVADCDTIQVAAVLTNVLPHSAPSWILSLAENLASSILQDGAMEWHNYVPATTNPPTQPPTHLNTQPLTRDITLNFEYTFQL